MVEFDYPYLLFIFTVWTQSKNVLAAVLNWIKFIPSILHTLYS